MDRVILIMGRLGYRSFFYLGLIGLGNKPHMIDNGPHLSLGTFCPWDIFSLGCFVPWNVGRLRTFCLCIIHITFQRHYVSLDTVPLI